MQAIGHQSGTPAGSSLGAQPRTIPAAEAAAYELTTAEFAALNRVKPKSVIVALSRTGGFHGVRPLKLASRRLLWPEVVVTA